MKERGREGRGQEVRFRGMKGGEGVQRERESRQDC